MEKGEMKRGGKGEGWGKETRRKKRGRGRMGEGWRREEG